MKKILAALSIAAIVAIGILVGVVTAGDLRSEGVDEISADAGRSPDYKEPRFDNITPGDVVVVSDTNNDGKYDFVNIQAEESAGSGSSALSYQEYYSLPADKQEEWLERFESVESFFDWHNGAEAVYNANNETIVIGDGTTVELGVVADENGGNTDL